MTPRNKSSDRRLDRPIAVPALELPIPSNGGGFAPTAAAPRVISSTSPTLESLESGSLILVPGSAPHYRSAAGTSGGALATAADVTTAAGRLDDLEAIVVAATAGDGAKVVLAEPTGGGTSAVTMQAPALSAARTITIPDANVDLGAVAVNSAYVAAVLDQLVIATIAVEDVSGGGTDAALTLTLTQADGTALQSARQVMINAGSEQYNHFAALSSTVTFGTATTGSIVASGNGWALVQTSAAGAFACTASNSADETVYFSVDKASAGVSDIATACDVLGSNSDAATWSA